MAAETAFASFMSSMTQPFSVAQVSTENFPFTSVAVVITGTAPIAWAMVFVRPLAPPIWPDKREIAKVPCSSTHTTAGSVRLSRT